MALILTADRAMSAPLPGTPRLPDLSTGLALDYNPDTLRVSTANGSRVSSLVSQGTEPFPLREKLAGTEYPLFVSAGPNGHAALKFDGNSMITSSIAYVNGDVPILVQPHESITVAIVAKNAADALDTNRIFGVAISDGFRYLAPLAGGAGFRASQGTNFDMGGTAATWHVFIARFSNTGGALKLDAEPIRAVSLSNTNQMRGLRLGHTGTGTRNEASLYRGELARVMMYRRAMTDADIEALAYELRATYGIN